MHMPWWVIAIAVTYGIALLGCLCLFIYSALQSKRRPAANEEISREHDEQQAREEERRNRVRERERMRQYLLEGRYRRY